MSDARTQGIASLTKYEMPKPGSTAPEHYNTLALYAAAAAGPVLILLWSLPGLLLLHPPSMHGTKTAPS